MKRDCGSCTKCCEGYLQGSAYGKPFYPGRPCHFITIGKGCNIYAKRPKDPCISYTCEWLVNEEIPEWFKPNEINTIITKRKMQDSDIEFWDVTEAGETLRSDVLTWLVMYALQKGINLRWSVNGGMHWIGNSEFLESMNKANTM